MANPFLLTIVLAVIVPTPCDRSNALLLASVNDAGGSHCEAILRQESGMNAHTSIELRFRASLATGPSSYIFADDVWEEGSLNLRAVVGTQSVWKIQVFVQGNVGQGTGHVGVHFETALEFDKEYDVKLSYSASTGSVHLYLDGVHIETNRFTTHGKIVVRPSHVGCRSKSESVYQAFNGVIRDFHICSVACPEVSCGTLGISGHPSSLYNGKYHQQSLINHRPWFRNKAGAMLHFHVQKMYGETHYKWYLDDRENDGTHDWFFGGFHTTGEHGGVPVGTTKWETLKEGGGYERIMLTLTCHQAYFIIAADGSATCPNGYGPISDVYMCHRGMAIYGITYEFNRKREGAQCQSDWPASGCFTYSGYIFISSCEASLPVSQNQRRGICQLQAREYVWLKRLEFGWDDAARACVDQGMQLASLREYCPMNEVRGGRRDGNHWAPARDFSNAWIQIGSHTTCGTCEFHCSSTKPADAPQWGKTKEQGGKWKGPWFLCTTAPALPFETTTSSTTSTKSTTTRSHTRRTTTSSTTSTRTLTLKKKIWRPTPRPTPSPRQIKEALEAKEAKRQKKKRERMKNLMQEHRRRHTDKPAAAPWPRSGNGNASSETRLEKFGQELLKSTRSPEAQWHPNKCPKFCWWPPEEHPRKCEWTVCSKSCPSCYYQRSATHSVAAKSDLYQALAGAQSKSLSP